ncbi:MAG TPA: type II secretion system protein [Phycisphaerae bacterium]|nr:type II secretion system protein [Phycisphaerae bacterium]HOJ74234.1 type II secretion system protein [Phycisphaerae bacterium]HOM51313.1 type II secretion system protein [Phycisphaerae bacterium]HON65121.1 type II secretion system protein [Phycisphaerae bacterium]HOQ86176.1 type II secretion system protein [Phycisphaerae bacterium]
MSRSRTTGFSLIELVIVIVILAVISAIALPRISRGAKGADESALGQNLAVLRTAIETYAAEHGGKFPTVAEFEDQLTKYTNKAGTATSTTRDEANGIIYGPYLHKVPPLTVGDNAGKTKVAASAGADVGWIYDETTGKLTANVAAGVKASNGTEYASW